MVIAAGLEDGWQTLVVAPRLVCLDVWAREHLKWTALEHLDVSVLTGRDENDRITLLSLGADITVIHPDKLLWLLELYGARWPFKRVVWDESTRLMGFRTRQGTKRSRGIADVAHTRVKSWINLSGTPNANGYRQLWGPQWFIDGGEALGKTYSAYEDRYFMRPPHGGEFTPLQLIPGMEEAIQERLRPTTFTVQAADYMDLEKPIETVRYFDLAPSVRATYRQMQRDMRAAFDRGEVTAVNAGVKAGKLRQISAGIIYHHDGGEWSLVHEERLDLLRALRDELRGKPLLVVYKYKAELAMLQKAFRDGKEIREPLAISDWNAGRVPMLFCHPKSAGHGINLQDGGHHICFFSPMTDNEGYQQVLARIGPVRQASSGYKRPVFIYRFECEKSIDQYDQEIRLGRITELGAFMQIMSENA